MRCMFELVPVRVAEAANEPWLAFAPRQGVSVTRLGEYTRVVLTKPDLCADYEDRSARSSS